MFIYEANLSIFSLNIIILITNNFPLSLIENLESSENLKSQAIFKTIDCKYPNQFQIQQKAKRVVQIKLKIEQKLKNQEKSQKEDRQMCQKIVKNYSLDLINKQSSFPLFTEQIKKEMKPIQKLLKCWDHEQYFQNLKRMAKETAFPNYETGKKVLFIDLDQTLIHTVTSKESYQYKLRITIKQPSQSPQKSDIQSPGKEFTVRFILRSFACEFLKEMSKIADLVLFTAAQQEYARGFFNFFNQRTNGSFKEVFSRSDCIPIMNKFAFKDPRQFKNLSQKDFLVIDNSLSCFFPVLENGVLVSTFIDDKNDQQLLILAKHIQEAVKFDDIRTYTRQKYSLLKIFHSNI